ncbi:hypothetical protein BH18ACT1_BH18ACT1_04960 [soil metagenome]
MLFGITGVVLGLGVLVGFAVLASRGDVEANLGEDVFEAGRTGSQAPAIERDGPLLLADVAGGDRDVYLQHVGSDEERGWFAFDARVRGASRECTIEWQADDEEFEDPCDGRRYPADGEGLRQADVDVDDGGLLVNLRTE